MTGLHMIVMLEKWDLLDILFEFPSISLTGLDEYNNTILHYVTLSNNLEYLQKILAVPGVAASCLPVKNFGGDEPIHTSIYNDSLDSFVAILNKLGRSESHEEFIVGRNNLKGENCLQLTIRYGSLNIFRYCMEVMKKIDYLDEQQKTPLFYIVDSNNYEFMEVYLSKKSNLKTLNSNKENLLFYCIKHGKTSFFKVGACYKETPLLLR